MGEDVNLHGNFGFAVCLKQLYGPPERRCAPPAVCAEAFPINACDFTTTSRDTVAMLGLFLHRHDSRLQTLVRPGILS